MRDGHICKAEALIRWYHPAHGMISPVEFIPIAEHTGLIVAIGDWVFHEALRQATQWRALAPHFTVAVNISPVQFYRNNGDSQRDWLTHCASDQPRQAEAPAVGLEITEGLLLTANASVMQQMQAFRDAGIGISLDDFGTGYSSLSYLRKFSLDSLKIDRSFVDNLEHDGANIALCEAIIVMAHKLGLKVIAEGVETRAQHALLREAGCDFAQGYLFGQALPPDQFEALLRA
jgi:EAL domain-containing protein (putative c-di-GMP-specific phosphodiesterase class I)